MTIKNSLRCEVDHKVWEPCTPAPFATVAGSHTICDPSGEDRGTLLMINAATVLRYDHKHGAWTLMPASGAAGTFGAGSSELITHMGRRARYERQERRRRFRPRSRLTGS